MEKAKKKGEGMSVNNSLNSSIVLGMEGVCELISALFEEVREQGGTEDYIARLIASGKGARDTIKKMAAIIVADGAKHAAPQLHFTSIPMTYPNGKNVWTLNVLLDAGNYDSVNPFVSSQVLFAKDLGCLPVGEKELVLVSFSRRPKSLDSILAVFEEHNLLPAGPLELLCLGRAHRNLQLEGPILAPGFVWTTSGGYKCMVMLCSKNGGRDVDLHHLVKSWPQNSRFLAKRRAATN